MQTVANAPARTRPEVSLRKSHIPAARTLSLLLFVGLGAGAHVAAARGVSPYLPQRMSPEMERNIERVLLLGDKPIMRRPIAAAVVLDALPNACAHDKALCEEVRRYLRRFMSTAGVTNLKLSGTAADGDSDSAVPNEHGLDVDNPWELRARAYYQPTDYLLISAGVIAREDETVATDSMISLGFDFAQLDVGFRDHWLSPLMDSSSLISTQAATMPSVTLSNYRPISPFGFSYEVFAARMSRQNGIAFVDTSEDSTTPVVSTTSGHPRLAGLQLGIEPASGFALAANRLVQYGGGARNTGRLSQFREEVFETGNRADVTGTEASNRLASLTSSLLFPGKVPFAVRIEYAGEDNSYSGSYRLGATNLSLGLDFPKLWDHYDFSYEVSEWQNDWYVHPIYPAGLANRGHVIGHWFGDERYFGDAIGGYSQMVRAGWRSPSGQYWQAIYRTSKHDPAWRRGSEVPGLEYEQTHALTLNMATTLLGRAVSAELQAGRDAFGDSFTRFVASVDIADTRMGSSTGSSRSYETQSKSDPDTEVFVDLGANYSSVLKIQGVDIDNVRTNSQANVHIGVGARRKVADRSDFGVRLEADRVDGYDLLSLRAIDYRFRWTRKFALNGFFGVGRYDVGLPAYGYYFGAGLQYRDVLPKWDVSLDLRRYDKLGRDKTLPNDPPATPDRTRLFFDVDGIAFYVSRRL
jgi:hypothetical protein